MFVMMFGTLTTYASSGGGGVSIDTGEDSNKYNYDKMSPNLIFHRFDSPTAMNNNYTSDIQYDFDFSNAPADLKKFLFIEHNDMDMTFVRVFFISLQKPSIPYEYGRYNVSIEVKNGVCVEKGRDYFYKKSNFNSALKNGYYAGYFEFSCYGDLTFDKSVSFGKFDKIVEFSVGSGLSGLANNYDVLFNLINGGENEFARDDTEESDFIQGDADYVKDIGYLQNVVKKIRAMGTADGVAADFKEVRYEFTWDSVTNTDFNVTADNVYVSYYHQILGYKKDLFGGKKEQIVGSKVFIDRVKGSDLKLIAYQTDINNKCAEDLAKLDYTPLLQTISRNDANWFRIEVYHPDTNTWSYGGWVKIFEKGNGDQTDETTTWEPDPDGGNDDTQDTDGGYGDGEDTPGDYGFGETEEEADDNAKPITPSSGSYTFSDFVSLLDSLTRGIGEFPELVGKVFSFLPSEFNLLLCSGLAVIIVLRILGR